MEVEKNLTSRQGLPASEKAKFLKVKMISHGICQTKLSMILKKKITKMNKNLKFMKKMLDYTLF